MSPILNYKMKLKIVFFLLFAFYFTFNVQAQTPITTNGSFTVNSEVFSVEFYTLPSAGPTPRQMIIVSSNRNRAFPDANYFSATCDELQHSYESRKYRFAKNRSNSMQVFAILKTVFSPQRCAQLGNNNFNLHVSVFPNNNTINDTQYNFLSTVGVTQEEIAQLDNLIRTTTTFTFPKIAGICTNVSSITIGSIRFEFGELHTNPRYNGIGASFDGD